MQPQDPTGQPNDPTVKFGDQQNQPGNPQSQPGYSPQGQPGYPPQGYPGYPPTQPPGQSAHGQASFPPPGQAGDSPQSQPGYPQQSGYPQGQQGMAAPGQPGYPQGPQANPGGAPAPWPNAPVGGQMIGSSGPGPGLGGIGGRVARGAGFGVMRLVVLVVGAALVAGISWGCHQFTKSDAEKVQVGQCLKLAGTSHDPKFTITSCDSMDANYKVVDNQDNSTCADDNDESAWQTGKYSYHLCMQLNVKQGDCLHKALDYETKVDCSSSDADYKVTNIVSGAYAVSKFSGDSSDADGCGDSATKFAKYTTPDPKVVCLGPAH